MAINEMVQIIIGLFFGLIYVLGIAWLDYSIFEEECREIGIKFKWYKSLTMWFHLLKLLAVICLSAFLIKGC